MRLLIYIMAVFIGYQVYKAVQKAFRSPYQVHRKKPDEVITAELVEDPVCHTYCPKNDALMVRIDAGTYYFCSEECKRKFVEMRKGEQA